MYISESLTTRLLLFCACCMNCLGITDTLVSALMHATLFGFINLSFNHV